MRNGAARGRVLGAVARTWPVFVTNAVKARAYEHVEAGRFDEAAVVLEEAVERYGNDTVPHLLIAWTLVKADRLESAHEWAVRAVETEPDDAQAHWLLGNILLDCERRDEAEAELRKAVELDPGNGDYHMELALVIRENADAEAVFELMDKALELSPDSTQVQFAAGRILDYRLRRRRAQSHYERAIELDPGNVEAHYALGALLQARGRISRGVAHVHEVEPAPGEEAGYEEVYTSLLLRWSWRWYEWALRSALVLDVVDWILPTPSWGGVALAAPFVTVFAVQWARTFAHLPARCRRDLFTAGRRRHFAAAATRTALVLAGTVAILLMEPNGWQHLGALVVIVLGYVDWCRRAIRVSGH